VDLQEEQMSRIATRCVTALAFATSVLLAPAASAQDVSFNAMPNVDFAKFKTYKWVQIKGAEYPDQIMDSQIKDSLDKALATKGLTKTDADTADLFIGYQAAVNQEKEWNTYTMGGSGWGYGAGWYGYGGGGTATTTSTTINIGTLGVDMYDPAKKQLVWRGRASKTLDVKAKPEKRKKNLDKAVAKMLKNYPPPPPKS
jgi:hypothetical protein